MRALKDRKILQPQEKEDFFFHKRRDMRCGGMREQHEEEKKDEIWQLHNVATFEGKKI